MAISDTISSMTTNISNAYSSIQAKSGTIPANKNLQNLSTAIDSIPSGGSPTPTTLYLVRVFDYDGTILKSQNLATGDTFTMPTAPTHSGLTFQEWSGNATVTNNTITVGSNDIIMGATYTTTSGLTEIDVELTKVIGKSVSLILTGSIDWGDGTTDTGTGNEITHTYADYGKYTITFGGSTLPASSITTSTNYYITDIRIGQLIASLTYQVFSTCWSLKTITIPNTVYSISSNAMQNCYSLGAVIIPNGIQGINASVLSGCFSLQTVVIPNTVRSVGVSAFNGCRSLKYILIPSGVTNLNNATALFSNCYGLEKVVILAQSTKLTETTFNGCTSLKEVILSTSFRSIVANNFVNCYALEKITIPSGITSIGNDAFKNCRNLSEITLPSTLTTINLRAFQDCYALRKITMPSVTQIKGSAFLDCSALSEITLPNTLTTIGNNAFQNCYSLGEIIIPNSVTSLGTYAFDSSYGGLKKITFSNSCPISASVCSGSYALSSITIPSGVTSIGNYAFNNCSSLQEIVIPNTVTTIGSEVFRGCYVLRKYDFSSFSTIPTLSGSDSLYVNDGTKIIVPDSLYDTWIVESNWSAFANYIYRASEVS